MVRFYGIGNRMMAFGTGERAEDGSLVLTDLAKRRADKVAEVYYNHSFNRKGAEPSILLSGGYGKREFPDEPPMQREAQLMAEYLIEQYFIPKSAMLIEDESTDTDENFKNSLQGYPDFFDYMDKKRLGLVSHESHLKNRVIEAGVAALAIDDALSESGKWHRLLPAREPIFFSKTSADIKVLHEEAAKLAAD